MLSNQNTKLMLVYKLGQLSLVVSPYLVSLVFSLGTNSVSRYVFITIPNGALTQGGVRNELAAPRGISCRLGCCAHSRPFDFPVGDPDDVARNAVSTRRWGSAKLRVEGEAGNAKSGSCGGRRKQRAGNPTNKGLGKYCNRN